MIKFDIADLPDQKFATALNGRRVSIRLRYNVAIDRWSFDLSVDGDAVLHGRRVVCGVDLLAAFDFGIGVIFAAATRDEMPGRDALPSGIVGLYHTTQAEIDAAISS